MKKKLFENIGLKLMALLVAIPQLFCAVIFDTPVKPYGDALDLSKFELVWQDEFDGEELNRQDWNVELHEPGWVNEESQEYVDSKENIFLHSGLWLRMRVSMVSGPSVVR